MVLTRAKSKQNLQDSGSAPQSAATSTSVAGKSQQQQQDQSTMNGQQHLNGNNVAHRSSPAKQAKTNGTPAAPTSQQGDTSFADYVAAPKTTSFEFMGPPGAFAISTLVPYFTYFFALGCDERGCPSTPFIPYMQDGLRQATTLDFWISLWDNEATLAYLAWYAWCIVCWAVLPGQWLEGGKLRNGEKLWYKINGEWVLPMLRCCFPHSRTPSASTSQLLGADRCLLFPPPSLSPHQPSKRSSPACSRPDWCTICKERVLSCSSMTTGLVSLRPPWSCHLCRSVEVLRVGACGVYSSSLLISSHLPPR